MSIPKDFRNAILNNTMTDLRKGLYAGHQMTTQELRSIVLDLAIVLKDLSDRLDSDNPT